MDEILNKYLILMIYLALASYWDITRLVIPRWISAFAFFGWLILAGKNRMYSLAFSAAFALIIYVIFEMLSRSKGFAVLGRGDIHIIFIMGLYMEAETLLLALLFSCAAALIILFALYFFAGVGEIPLAPAFLFGALAALW